MTSKELLRLHQNPFYIQANEFFMNESTLLSEMLEEMGWSPVTPEQRRAIKLQCERTKQTRLVLKQFRELARSTQESSSPPPQPGAQRACG
jgi:hypothetical protein